jgi:succinoglycan biosynthesis transport protein ExoP
MDTQLQATIVEMQILKENQTELTAKLKRYEDQILKAPMVEKNYMALLRDQQNATLKYQEIKAKQMSAELAQTLEQGRKGQRFTLIDPPALPEEPVSPNRPVIIFLGFILALGFGVGTVILMETVSPAVRGAAKLAEVVGASPLVSIPYISIEEESSQEDYQRYYMLGGVVAAGLAFLITIHFVYKPLDVLWFVILRKLGLG